MITRPELAMGVLNVQLYIISKMILVFFMMIRGGLPNEMKIDLAIKSKNADNFFNRRRKFMRIEDPKKPCHYNDYYSGFKKRIRPISANITQFDHTGQVKENGHTHYNNKENINNGLRVMNPPDICVGYTGKSVKYYDDNNNTDDMFRRKILLEYEDDGRDRIKRSLKSAFNEEFEEKDLLDIDNDTEMAMDDMQNTFEQIYSVRNIFEIGGLTESETRKNKLLGMSELQQKSLGIANHQSDLVNFLHGEGNAYEEIKEPLNRMSSNRFYSKEGEIGVRDEQELRSVESSHNDEETSYDDYQDSKNEAANPNKGYLLKEGLRTRKSEAEQFVDGCDRDPNCRDKMRSLHGENNYDIHTYPEYAGRDNGLLKPFKMR